MKKIFLSWILMLVISSVFAQQEQEIVRYKIITAGTAELLNGAAVITLEQEVNPDMYFVQLTPVDQHLKLYITDRKSTGFVVRADGATKGIFQYLIYVRKAKVREIEDPNKEQ